MGKIWQKVLPLQEIVAFTEFQIVISFNSSKAKEKRFPLVHYVLF